MSHSWDERRRVAAVRTAQRTAAAHRYQLDTRSVPEEPVEAPPVPATGFDPGWLEPPGQPDAPPLPHAMLRASVQQAMAGESWGRGSTNAAAPDADMPLPAAEPPPAPQPPKTRTSQPVSRGAVAGSTMSSEAAAAFDIGLQQMAWPPAHPAVGADDSPREAAPIPVWEGVADDEWRLDEGPPPALPWGPRPPVAQPPAGPMTVPQQVAAAFEAGVREMSSCPPPPSRPQTVRMSQMPQTPQTQAPPARAPRGEDPPPVQQAPGDEAVPMPLPNEVATLFDAGVRDMASPLPRPATPPAQRSASLDGPVDAQADRAEPDPRDRDDALQPAQQALDARLAQLTFRGIVTGGG
ncbi:MULTISPECIES: hypothetical protein [unclassified Rhizobacter]|uniref:hypothetical protein n=1 Tax=unclassified Rhizobacter TaxID=2640088 RepID=UPI0006F8ADD0|nr:MULTISPECIES: hypothetical protein [unclassified Rhizobacter]KQU67196.1 hypothetical protein ASC88_09320 [Rhizobacter sp. Root29]KQV98093.1 hypothetical protein ASC98_08745 [Rhizobacter sp. Root1238]KRB01991.1 hypothetical protein ASE08_16305 [Rhizobacter sp. Root16D2]